MILLCFSYWVLPGYPDLNRLIYHSDVSNRDCYSMWCLGKNSQKLITRFKLKAVPKSVRTLNHFQL